MPKNKLLGTQVKHLLSGVSDHGTQHLVEVEADLIQTALLLGEAIEKLGENFMAIHAAVCAQQETVNLLLSGEFPAPEYTEKLKDVDGEIGRHVSAVITGLQFQDLTSQLISRTVMRVTKLREYLDTLGSGCAVMPADSDYDEIAILLGHINETLATQSAELHSVLRKVVNQTHMGSGDVELF